MSNEKSIWDMTEAEFEAYLEANPDFIKGFFESKDEQDGSK